MDLLNNLALGFGVAFTFQNVLYAFFGAVLGTLIGAFMLTFLVNGCTHAGYANWVQEIVIGAIIVLAVSLDYFRRKSPT